MAACAAAAGLVAGSRGEGDDEPTPQASRPAGPESRLSLERQVGELLVMSFDGDRMPGYIGRRLARGQGTGVILFGRNAPDRARLGALTRAIQRAARGHALVSTDQEGGEIRSVGFAGPDVAQPQTTGVDSARRAAAASARELRSLGVNVNLAPVADVAATAGSVVAGRAFPGDAAAVSGLVESSATGMMRAGVAATVKHFPGLGRATANTDDRSVTIAAARAEILEGDVPPFARAARAGAPLVMASHALYPALDGDRIASQSRAVLDGLLRTALGFRGVVVTDSIEAQAVLDRSGVAVAAERSVAAGADLVLMTGSGSWNLIQPRLVRRARRDPRFRARVEEAAGRVLALKRRLGLRAAVAR